MQLLPLPQRLRQRREPALLRVAADRVWAEVSLLRRPAREGKSSAFHSGPLQYAASQLASLPPVQPREPRALRQRQPVLDVRQGSGPLPVAAARPMQLPAWRVRQVALAQLPQPPPRLVLGYQRVRPVSEAEPELRGLGPQALASTGAPPVLEFPARAPASGWRSPRSLG